MKKLTFLFVLLGTLFSNAQKARSAKMGQTSMAELQMTSYDKDPSASALILYDEGNYYMDEKNDYDLTTVDNLPDGAGFEICKLSAYTKSWKNGNSRHRSELCSLYIRENKSDFKINYVEIPSEIKRLDIRLTVDYPEDLVFCRKVYNKLKEHSPRIPLTEIIKYIDKNPKMKELVDPLVDEGLKTMYI